MESCMPYPFWHAQARKNIFSPWRDLLDSAGPIILASHKTTTCGFVEKRHAEELIKKYKIQRNGNTCTL